MIFNKVLEDAFQKSGRGSMRKLLFAVVVLFMHTVTVFGAGIYEQSFDGYKTGKILCQRGRDGDEIVSVDGYHVSSDSDGGTVTVGETGDPGLGKYIYASGKTFFWQHAGDRLTSVLAGKKPVIRFEFTERWFGGDGRVWVDVGRMEDKEGRRFTRAFGFRNKTWSYSIVDARGEEHAASGNESKVQGGWEDVRIDIDPRANNGDGSLCLYWRLHGEVAWNTKDELCNINLHLKSQPEVADPATWTDIRYYLAHGGKEKSDSIASMFVSRVSVPTGAPVITLTGTGVYEDGFDKDVLRNWESPGGMSYFTWDRGMGHRGKGSIRIGRSTPWVTGRPIAVKAGEYISARVWAKTQQVDDKARTYITLDWYHGNRTIGRTLGGSPFGSNTYAPNPIVETTDWTELMACGFAPKSADRVRLTLHSDTNSGWAWFDDLRLRKVPASELLGELDRKPLKIDVSKLTPEDYVTVKDGHLHYKGRRIRIWSAQGNLLRAGPVEKTHADIDFEVKRFAEHGFNGFRTLWWREVVDNYTPGDLSDQDLLDYMIADLGRHGVFVWNDMLNGCEIRPDMAGVIDDPKTAGEWTAAVKEWLGGKKYGIIRNALAAAWDPRIQKIYHNYIRKLLAHRNPYNGLTYAEDPTFFTWELTNEGWWLMQMMWGNYLKLPNFFQKELYDKWDTWLRHKYGDQEKLSAAWKGLLNGESLKAGTVLLMPLLGDTNANEMAKTLGINITYTKVLYSPKDFSKARAADVIQFLTELEIKYKQEAAKVFKSQGRRGLGAQIVPLLYDTGYSGAVLPYYVQSFGDATTVACYLDMRSWGRYDPKNNPRFPFSTGLYSPPLINNFLDSKRVAGKPAFIYENMVFAPQKYRVEYFYRLLAFAAIQDFDVVDFHYYGHPVPFPMMKNPFTTHTLQYMQGNQITNGLIMRPDEVMMSAVKLAGEIFKRGYLKPAPNPTIVTLGRKTMWSFDSLKTDADLGVKVRYTVFNRGFRWAFNPKQEKDTVEGVLVRTGRGFGSVVKPTDQISYRYREGIMVIDDPRAKVLVGFVPKTYTFKNGLRLKNISVNTPKGMPFAIKGERYIGFGIVSLDGQPLDKSGRILVSAVNTSFNSGFAMNLKKMAGDKAYAYGLSRSIINAGKLPVLVGRVGVTLQAAWLKGRSYRMIDYNNNVVKKGVCETPALTIPSDLPVYLTEITK